MRKLKNKNKIKMIYHLEKTKKKTKNRQQQEVQRRSQVDFLKIHLMKTRMKKTLSLFKRNQLNLLNP